MAAVMDERIYKTAAQVMHTAWKRKQVLVARPKANKLTLVFWNQHEAHSLLSGEWW